MFKLNSKSVFGQLDHSQDINWIRVLQLHGGRLFQCLQDVVVKELFIARIHKIKTHGGNLHQWSWGCLPDELCDNLCSFSLSVFSWYMLHVMFYPLSVMLMPPWCTAAALNGWIAPMRFDILSFINRDLTGQQQFCCTDELPWASKERRRNSQSGDHTHKHEREGGLSSDDRRWTRGISYLEWSNDIWVKSSEVVTANFANSYMHFSLFNLC